MGCGCNREIRETKEKEPFVDNNTKEKTLPMAIRQGEGRIPPISVTPPISMNNNNKRIKT
jgi:hypothetical protein